MSEYKVDSVDMVGVADVIRERAEITDKLNWPEGWKDAVRAIKGGTEVFAVIVATYPEGSACVCSDGTKTLYAETSDGKWIFVIPHAGTWTVSCDDGTLHAEKVVEITEEHQSVNVELFYKLVIFKDGQYGPAGAMTIFATTSSTNPKPSATIMSDGALRVKTGNRSASASSMYMPVGIYFPYAVDLTPYSRLTGKVKHSCAPYTSGNNAVGLRVSAPSTQGSISYFRPDDDKRVVQSGTSLTDVNLDLSAFKNGETLWVGVSHQSNTVDTESYVDIYELVLDM